jgi:UDPglucose 6-dehydrogenase
LGIVYSTASAAKGFQTLAFDPDQPLVQGLERGEFPVQEPDLFATWTEHRALLEYTAEVEKLGACRVVFISLDVPTSDDHRSDLSSLRSLIDLVVPHLAAGAVLVLLNQVPPGFTREQCRRFPTTQIYYQVETLIFGRAVERALRPERYIVGLPLVGEELPESYAAWLQAFACPVVKMGLESAELAKTAINLFLVSSVSTTNLLAELCENIGADWNEIVPALRLDQRIGPAAYLWPGLGISGGNLPRDLISLRELAEQHGTEAGLIDTWLEDSAYRRGWVQRQLERELLPEQSAPNIAVWGLAYIANTASIKNSAAIELMRANPAAQFRVYDPVVKSIPGEGCQVDHASSALDALDGADALCVMTPWSEFSGMKTTDILERLRGRLVLDPLGVLNGEECRAAGLRYRRLGLAAA